MELQHLEEKGHLSLLSLPSSLSGPPDACSPGKFSLSQVQLIHCLNINIAHNTKFQGEKTKKVDRGRNDVTNYTELTSCRKGALGGKV